MSCSKQTILFALVVWLLDVTSAFDCPVKNDLVPHPSDCSRYYRCSNWAATPMYCYNGLHFNGGLRVCTSPDTAFCQTRQWRMMLRASAGGNLHNLYEAWMGTQPINDCNCTLVSTSTNVKGTYRARWVDDWHLISQVHVAIYVNGATAKNVRFHAGDNKHNFFNASNIIKTDNSWSDVETGPHNFFSIQGHKLWPYNSQMDHDRRFFIWQSYNGGCDHNKGWMMVADLLHGPGRCWWEKRLLQSKDLPFFLYNPHDTAQNPSEFLHGHVFIIWGKVIGDYGQGCGH